MNTNQLQLIRFFGVITFSVRQTYICFLIYTLDFVKVRFRFFIITSSTSKFFYDLTTFSHLIFCISFLLEFFSPQFASDSFAIFFYKIILKFSYNFSWLLPKIGTKISQSFHRIIFLKVCEKFSLYFLIFFFLYFLLVFSHF